eukprot:snap_masked-scaffold_1-processed-gene-4.45-mRNA-1 protein AED:1.00 eAED:1.00 QI:0/-1/0/0/-1/1/1/0/164
MNGSDIVALSNLLSKSNDTENFRLKNAKQKVKIQKECRKENDSGNIWRTDKAHKILSRFDRLRKQANGRKEPEYDIKYRIDSTQGKMIVMKVTLPNQKCTNLDVQVGEQWVVISTSKYFLATYLPDSIYTRSTEKPDDVVNVRWDKMEHVLTIVAPAKLRHFLK